MKKSHDKNRTINSKLQTRKKTEILAKTVRKENFLIEIGTEEIPARFLIEASRNFKELILNLLKENRIAFNGADTKVLFTPRRLTVFVPAVHKVQEDYVDVIKGPPASIALNAQGQWTQAGLSFAERNGVSPARLIRQKTEKGEYFFVEKRNIGKTTDSILKNNLGDLIRKIKFPKSMRWGEGKIYFARPIRWIVALLGSHVISFDLESVTSSHISFGYRWLAQSKFVIPRADLSLYKTLLKKKGVYADNEERLNFIQALILKTLGSKEEIHSGDRDTLEEVVNLVEYPSAGEGTFDKKFLSIPNQVLSSAIKHHQKYLPVYEKGKELLLAKFIVIYNGPIRNLRKVVAGNERVLRARLSDAAFFWDKDGKKSLADRVLNLKNVVFQENLGSYYDKVERLKNLTFVLGHQLNLDSNVLGKLRRAVLLCKADLVTEMVGEFPSLQGVIGREYALLSGEDSEVAQAVGEHYQPTSGNEGDLPKTIVGSLLALIDKLDSVAGVFKLGRMPTGSQDPYGIRRLSSGILRILYEKGISLSLKKCVEGCLDQYASKELSSEVLLKFFHERLENLFLSLGYDHDLVRAVLDRQIDDPAKAYKILKDLKEAQDKPFFQETVTVVERTFNILKGQKVQDGGINENLLKEKEEIELYTSYKANYDTLVNLIKLGDFLKVTSEYARCFFGPVHVFFDKVLVNVEDQTIRQNRYQLLKKIHELYAREVADLSRLARAR